MNIKAQYLIMSFSNYVSDEEVYEWMQEFNDIKWERSGGGQPILTAFLPNNIALRYDEIIDIEQYYSPPEEDVYFVSTKSAKRAHTVEEYLVQFQYQLRTHGAGSGNLRMRVSTLEHESRTKRVPFRRIISVWTEFKKRFHLVRHALRGHE